VSALLDLPPDALQTPSIPRDVVEAQADGDRNTEGLAARVFRVQLQPDHIETAVGYYRNAVMWMATSEEGFRGFLLLVDEASHTIVSIGLWESEFAMRHSRASVFLPLGVLQFQHMLTEPVTIEYYNIAAMVRCTEGQQHGRLCQIDHRDSDDMPAHESVEQFQRLANDASNSDQRLERAMLLLDPAAKRSTAVGIWHEEAENPPQQHPRETGGAYFPQLLDSASSRHYRIEVDV
jgi:hypothetical protein